MSRPARQDFLAQLDRVVAGLGASGLSEAHLRWGALVALDQGLPLRDSIVLRHARQREAMETDRARRGWSAAVERLRSILAPATMRDFIDPVELVGESEDLLVLTAPTALGDFIERRYGPLLHKAVRAESDYSGCRFASVRLPTPLREVYAG